MYTIDKNGTVNDVDTAYQKNGIIIVDSGYGARPLEAGEKLYIRACNSARIIEADELEEME